MPMTHPSSLSKQASALLHSMMLTAIVSFFLEPNIVGAYFQMSFWTSPFGILTAVCFVILRILFFGGMYASLIEIASGEKDLLTAPTIWSNAKTYWWLYGGLALIPVAVDFLRFALLPKMDIPILYIGILLDPMILYIFALVVISKKYLQPMKIPKQTPRLTARSALLLCAVVFMALALAHCSNGIPAFPIGFERLKSILYNSCFFSIKYLHFFLFLYFCVLIFDRHPEVKKQLSLKKEIVLVSPPGGGLIFSISSLLSRPATSVFVLLKAMTPPRYTVRVYNQVLWKNRYYGPGKLVGITCCTSNAAEGYRIAKKFRTLGSKVIMGGAHVMFLPDEALKFCDSVIIGDAEPVWHQILEDFDNNCLKKIYTGEQTGNYHRLSHHDLLQLEPKPISQYIETGRGCKFHCDFCAVPAICGKQRQKPIPEVIELLKKIKGHVSAVNFIDNNLFADPHYAKELFQAMKPLNIKWNCSCSIDIARDDEALRLAKESGCILMIIGYEISDESAEKAKGGKYSMAKDYLTLTRKIKNAGIGVKGQFIFGFDADSFKSLTQLWQFCAQLFLTFTIIALLTPFPGSKHFTDVVREKRLLNLNWSRYNLANLVFQPRNINPRLYTNLYPLIFVAFLATSSHGLALLVLLGFGKKIIEDGGKLLLTLARL